MKQKVNNIRTSSNSVQQNKQQEPRQIATNLLFIVSFLEGAAVMIIELLGAKIIAPFYGTSLYVWASVLGVTLFSLALGYYLGGVISQRAKREISLFLIIGIGSLFTLLAPTIAPFIMKSTASYGVRAGSLISVLCYLTPPITCMGMVSPIIIQIINQSRIEAGKSAGTIFAISTVGGILATFIAGFYLIPELGIKLTATLTSIILGIIAIIGLLNNRKIGVTLSFIILFLIAPLIGQKKKQTTSDTKIQYQSSGILGEWTVVDRTQDIGNGNIATFRRLLLNGIDQTITQVGFEPSSTWSYPHKIAALAGIKPVGSKALLLGMGGGSISLNLARLGFEVDIIELDPRIELIAQKYFNFNSNNLNLKFDDARHYINNCSKKYDLVIIDLLSGEVQPSHVFTKEGFTSLKKILNKNALFIINFQGRFDMNEPTLSLAPRSIYKTLKLSGYNVQFCEKLSNEEKSLTGDILIYGSPDLYNFTAELNKDLRYNKIDSLELFTSKDFIPNYNIDLDDALVLIDDKPQLELINAFTVLEWRSSRMKFTEELFLKKGLPLYH